MTDLVELRTLKTIAKRFARAHRIPHHVALDQLASELDYPHWKALTVAWEKGWRPSLSQMETLRKLEAARPHSHFELPGPDTAPLDQLTGEIDGHPYVTSIDFEVLMYGRGWAICVEQAPSEPVQIRVTDRRIKANPILDPAFRAKALAIANEAGETLRARIARDWPRRSTKPDARGRVRHPLFLSSELSSEWHCLHCDGVLTGAQMVANMWHCPKCNATPIDIHAAPFWKAAS